MTTNAQIRSFRSTDEPRIRQICFETALYGGPIRALIDDQPLVTDALLGYYLRFEPESILIAEKNGEIAGYLTGCIDTHRSEKIIGRKLFPGLCWRIVAGGLAFQAPVLSSLFPALRGLHRALEAKRNLISQYPAHLHMNLDSRFQGQGIGSVLLETHMGYLREKHIPGIHLSTGTEGGKAFFAKKGFVCMTRYIMPEIMHIPAREIWIMARAM